MKFQDMLNELKALGRNRGVDYELISLYDGTQCIEMIDTRLYYDKNGNLYDITVKG